jgi:hypothetical protein
MNVLIMFVAYNLCWPTGAYAFYVNNHPQAARWMLKCWWKQYQYLGGFLLVLGHLTRCVLGSEGRAIRLALLRKMASRPGPHYVSPARIARLEAECFPLASVDLDAELGQATSPTERPPYLDPVKSLASDYEQITFRELPPASVRSQLIRDGFRPVLDQLLTWRRFPPPPPNK